MTGPITPGTAPSAQSWPTDADLADDVLVRVDNLVKHFPIKGGGLVGRTVGHVRAVDGVSLTVNEVDGTRFGVNIIPHTSKVTTFGRLKPGSRVNFEIDLLARYVARLARS